MGFFQELKEDLSLAVNELLPEDEIAEDKAAKEENNDYAKEANQIAAEAAAEMSDGDTANKSMGGESNTLSEEMFRAAVDRIDENADAFATGKTFAESFVEELQAEEPEPVIKVEQSNPVQIVQEPVIQQPIVQQPIVQQPVIQQPVAQPVKQEPIIQQPVIQQPIVQQPVIQQPVVPQMQAQAGHQVMPVAEMTAVRGASAASNDATQNEAFVQEVYEEVIKEAVVLTELEKEVNAVMEEKTESVMGMDVLDETATITKGMRIKGSISSQGALDVLGSITGDVEILGKLNVSGVIEGKSTASEVFADAANITGDIHATGTVKVGLNSVIIGNIYATSAVVAGAVKGDIDVQGPVVLDSTAIVMGNIKSKSVQMNNGAVIEGMCSQCYADVSPSAFFKDIK